MHNVATQSEKQLLRAAWNGRNQLLDAYIETDRLFSNTNDKQTPTYSHPRLESVIDSGVDTGRRRRPVAQLARGQLHFKGRPAGAGAQPGFGQARQPVGPTMRAFVRM